MSGIVESLDTKAAQSDSLAARLGRLIESECGAGSRVANLGAMEDGHAGLTFGFDVLGVAGQSLGCYVLKLAPVGVTRRGNTDVYRQAPLLRALKAAGVGVPAVPWASPDEGALGTPYIVMERLPGRVFLVWEPHNSFGRERAQLRRIWLQAARMLARLHGVDWQSVLPDWEKPRPLLAELDFWTPLLRHAPDPQWLAAGTELRSLLAADIPDGQPIGVAHGDFQPGNILYVDGRAETLIDWELASIGSQGLDLGWLLMMSDGEAWDPGWRPVAPVSRDDLVNAYREAGGPALLNIDWYQALAHFRGGAIACLNVKLHRSGKRRDDLWERFATSVPMLFARGIELARRAANRQGAEDYVIDFEIPRELAELRDRVDGFIADKIIAYENDKRQTAHGASEALRRELVELSRTAGLLSPHGPKEFGGLGLDHRGMAVVFEAAGWSTLGPLALNIQAPDEGNVNLLNVIATPEQKARWLAPLVRGEIRSVFSMTETVTDGAGSDPSLLQTTAQQTADGFVINGRKWMITGVPEASINIVMARTLDARGVDLGATMFFVDMDAPGFRVDRMLDTIDSNSPGGHAEVSFKDVHVAPDRVLGRIGEGFRNAQVRLGPARLTHCMRWLGAARRCHAIAAEYAGRRHSFGRTLGEHQGVGFMLADNEIDLHLSRLTIWHAAWLLDRHEHARDETSMSKVFCSEALGRVVDRSLQILGSIGITRDTVVERIYRDIRPFRIYDGPSEVHRHALARRIASRNTHRRQ